MVSLAMTVAGRWAQVLRNRVDDAHSCHGMPMGSTESTKLGCRGRSCFGADDVSTRKVERIFDVNLG